MIRIILAAPLIVTGQTISTIGYALAGAAHLNPHRRSS